MIRSMFSAISGLRNHQVMMDVVGNNIANVNTTGFKSSTVVFQDVLSQTLRGGSQPSTALGGTNPATVGLGSRIASITTSFNQGALQRTARATDMAVQGDGFFTVVQNGEQLFTRSGSFSVDAVGNLVSQDGGFVQGWQANGTGVVNTNATPRGLRIPVGDLIPPQVTTTAVLGGNLPSGQLTTDPPIASSVDVYDSLGNAQTLTLSFTKTGANTWAVSSPSLAAPFNLTFDATTGEIDPTGMATGPNGELGVNANVTGVGTVFLSMGVPGQANRVTQYARVNSITALSQDGSSAGSLQSFSVSQDGLITGSYSNGRSRAIGQLAVGLFTNPEGLEKVGGSNFRATVNSGLVQLGAAAQGGRGLLSSGTLEMSNVDLAQEFTALIVAQRGFQANSRVVSSSDDILQEIVNLKR